jgi:dihydroneopterin aldolase
VKPREPFVAAVSRAVRGWHVIVDELVATTRVGVHAHEQLAPQPVVVDARLSYRAAPSEGGEHGWIDYERYCSVIADFLAAKPHTRLLETLAAELAVLSFRTWPAIDALVLTLHKPKIREGTRRIAVALEWTRADYETWCMTEALAAVHT